MEEKPKAERRKENFICSRDYLRFKSESIFGLCIMLKKGNISNDWFYSVSSLQYPRRKNCYLFVFFWKSFLSLRFWYWLHQRAAFDLQAGVPQTTMYYPEPPHCGELWSTAYPARLALRAKERPSRCCFLHQNMKALGRTVERWKGKVSVASPSFSPWSPIGLTPSGCRFLEWWDAGKGLQEGAGCF